MSNITAMRCTKDEIWMRGADGREWTMTRAGIMAIYATKTGNAASRRTQTITDVLASGQTALGVDQFSAALAVLDFDAADSNKELLLSVT